MRSVSAMQAATTGGEERAGGRQEVCGRTLFQFSSADLVSCAHRDAGWSESCHTEVRSEAYNMLHIYSSILHIESLSYPMFSIV